MGDKWEQLFQNVISTIVFSVIGLILFALAWWIVDKITPFSLQKEIEEDHNVALGVIIGALFIAIAMIVSAAAHG